jgi:hypothetical protein
VFFPIYVNTQYGVRSVDPHLLEMDRAYGMSRGALFLRVVFAGRTALDRAHWPAIRDCCCWTNHSARSMP